MHWKSFAPPSAISNGPSLISSLCQEVQAAVESLLQLSSNLRFCSGVKEGLRVNIIVEGQNGLMKLFLGILVTHFTRGQK